MDTTQWAQGIGLVKKPMQEELVSSSSTTINTTERPPSQQLIERRARPQKEQALNCPRCNSTNTKFCYYNNYSLTQPRYFCKTCRRYWTEGGSLRNVPVGGGSRKNKRHSSSLPTPSSASSKNLPPDQLTPPPISSFPMTSHNSTKPYEGHDLNLAFPSHSLHDFGSYSNIEGSNTCNNTGGGLSAMELLRTGMTARGLGPLMQMSMSEASTVYGGGFGLQEFRSPAIKFPLEGGISNGGGGYSSMQEDDGRLLFPFGDLKQVSVKTSDIDQNRAQGGDPPMFWNGMMGGGGGSW